MNITITDDEHWHSLRSEHIGGSDIASLFYEVEMPRQPGEAPVVDILSICDPLPPGAQPMTCLSPYKTGYRRWLEKAGQLKPDFQENERIDAGTYLESAMAAWAMKKWPELQLRKVRRYMTHPLINGWGSTLDYETVKGLRPVEFKNVDALIFRDNWGASDDEIDAPPLHINLQLQAQLGVSGRDEGEIIACVGGNRLLRGKFALHEPTQLKIAEAIARFWESVRLGKPPLAYADIATASDFFRFGEVGKTTALSPETFEPIIARLKRLATTRKRIESIEDLLKGRVGVAMGAATSALAGKWKLSWPVIERAAQVYPMKWAPELTYRGGLRISEVKNGKSNRKRR